MRRPSAAVDQRPLFETPEASHAARLAFEARVCDFARAVALRHRRGGGDLSGLRQALVGYYQTLVLFATSPVPALDAVTNLATATYLANKTSARRRKAA